MFDDTLAKKNRRWGGEASTMFERLPNLTWTKFERLLNVVLTVAIFCSLRKFVMPFFPDCSVAQADFY